MNNHPWSYRLIGLAAAMAVLAGCAGPQIQAPTAAPSPPVAQPADTPTPSADEPSATTEAPTATPTAEEAEKVIIGAFDQGPGGFPERFDHFNATAGHYVFELYLSKLVRYCDTTLSSICGDLAESWELSPDGKTLTFKLRDAKWHDGTTVTADDVAFTLQTQLIKGAGRYSGFFSSIQGAQDFSEGKASSVTGIQVVDPKTIRIVLDRPNAALLDTLSFIGIIQKKQWEGVNMAENAKSDIWKTNIIGSGPFKFSKYVPGQYTEYVAFEDYYGGKPKVSKIINRYFPEPGTAAIALQKGEIDFTYVTIDELQQLQDNPDINIISGPSLVNLSLAFNRRLVPAFEDKRVRQAMLHAIDRKAIIESLWKGSAKPSNCFYSPGGPYDAPSPNPYEYDPQRAEELLKEANFDGSAVGELELLTYYNDQLSKDTLAVIAEQLSAVGIKTRLRFVDVPTFNSEFYSADPKWGIAFIGAGNGPEPDNIYTTHHSSEEWPKGRNIDPIRSAELDKLLDAGRSEIDPATRQQIYQQVCQLLNQEAMRGYLMESIRFGAASKKLGNFIYTPSPGGGRYLAYPERWTKN